MSVNCVLNAFKSSYTGVKYRLFKDYCMGLYGSVLWDFDSNDLSRFYTEWRKAICRLLHIASRTHSNFLHLLCDDRPIEIQMFQICNKFMHNIKDSENGTVQLAYKLAVRGSVSNVCRNVNLVGYKLNCSRDILGSSASVFNKYVTKCNNNSKNADDSQILGNIKDLLHLRDTN